MGDVLNGGIEVVCMQGATTDRIEKLPATNEFRITWDVNPCGSYTLEFSEDLVTWTNVAVGLLPTDPVRSVDSISTATSGVYRIICTFN